MSIPDEYYAKVNTVTEFAFNKLISAAKDKGVPQIPVMGLMYLPDPKVIGQFQEACRAIIELLLPEEN